MKNKLLFILIASVFFVPVFAQQKIKDNTIPGDILPNKDALLELESTNKGLLHARVQLIRTDDAAPLSQHRAGMMVYNTATVNDVSPGIYYNNGSHWILVAAMDDVKSISYNPVTYELSFVDRNGETQVIHLEEVVKAVETVTALDYDRAAHILDYIDEDGVAHTFNLNVGTLGYDQATNTLNYTAEDGTPTPIALNNTSLSYDAATGELTYTNSLGVTQTADLSDIVTSLETLTVMGYDAVGHELTYQDEDGTPHTLDLNVGTLGYDQATNTLNYTAEDGTPTPIALNNTSLSYDAATGELTYTNSLGVTQTADLSDIVTSLETLTTIEGNPVEEGGVTVYRVTYTDENENENTVDIKAINGLNIDGTTGEVKLGGILTEPTIIQTGQTSTANTLAITGLEYSTATDDKIVVADATTGVLKALKAAMPKFFYMPSIIIPTAEDQVDDPSDFGKIDLYQIYKNQFENPMASNNSTNTTLPVLPPLELDYYITWYDQNVFETVNVSDLGLLTYTVKTNADVTVGSFMNIVFAVKP